MKEFHVKVVYYINAPFVKNQKRLAKVTAILSMSSLNRGKVISADVESLDLNNKLPIHKDVIDGEIGKIKNISNCYEVYY